jgi:hypothetical protein
MSVHTVSRAHDLVEWLADLCYRWLMLNSARSKPLLKFTESFMSTSHQEILRSSKVRDFFDYIQ